MKCTRRFKNDLGLSLRERYTQITLIYRVRISSHEFSFGLKLGQCRPDYLSNVEMLERVTYEPGVVLLEYAICGTSEICGYIVRYRGLP